MPLSDVTDAILARLPSYRKRKEAEAMLAAEARRFHDARASSAALAAVLREHIEAAAGVPICLTAKKRSGCAPTG